MSVKSIKAGIKALKKEVEEEVRAATVRVCREAITTLCQRSPVWGGTYVENHRVSIDGAPVKKAYPPTPKSEMGDKLDEGHAIAIKAACASDLHQKLIGVKPFSVIRILNQTQYAELVEYNVIGVETAMMGPWMPFGKAHTFLMANATEIANRKVRGK